MANIRVKDLDTKASFASDDEILMDSPSGTGTMLRDAFIAAVASQIVAAPSTYKIATLDGANKLTSSQDPSQSVSYLGGHDMVANSPALADGTGTAGDTYYVTNPGTRNYGSGNITAQEGDALVYSGSVWQLVEGIANILDGISTASTARTTLSVNSIDEDTEATGTKLVGPALYFRGPGPNDYVEVADDAKLSFTDGTDDLPFSVSAWVKMEDASNFAIVAKNGASNPVREWFFWVNGSDKLEIWLRSTTGAWWIVPGVTALTSYEGSWIHLTATYGGAGPSSGTAFSAADTQVNLYVNGLLVAKDTTSQNGTYVGMSDTAQALRIGESGGAYAKGHIKDVKIFNRELTATEVSQLAKGNDLGFADEWGGALGGVYTSDFSAGVDGWAAFEGAAAGNIDGIGGQNDCLRYTINTATSSGHYLSKTTLTSAIKRQRIEFDYYIPSTNSHIDGIKVNTSQVNDVIVESAPTLDTWNHVSLEVVTNGNLTIIATDGGSASITDPGGDDVFYVRGIKVTEIGTLADFRAENFIADKLIDQSSNNFVGTNNGATLVGGRKALQLDTDGAAAGNNVLSIYNGSSHLAYLTDKGDLNANSISSGASTELTIATGAVTATKSYHTIDTESDAASDDLDTISGGRAGQILVVQANNSARSVVLKDGTGNLKLSGDITLDNAEDTATLVSDGTSWYLIATSNNGA